MSGKGRPSKYDRKFIAKISEYIEENQDTVEDNKLKVSLPTIEGFAVYIGVNKTTLYEWEKNHPNFSNALDELRQEQQQRLLNDGLSGAYNSTIAKLILSSNHGMAETNKVEHTGKDGQELFNLKDNDKNKVKEAIKSFGVLEADERQE